MKSGGSQLLLAGILSLVLLVGAATPAFAPTAPSDTIVITLPSGFQNICTFPEDAGETGGLIPLQGPPISSVCTSPLPPNIPLTGIGLAFKDSRGISDIILFSLFPKFCQSQICFASDSDTGSLDSLLAQLEAAGVPFNFIDETGSPQDLTVPLGGLFPDGIIQSITVQSDIEVSGGGAVGGQIMPVDMTSLFVAGVMTNASWMVPTLAGIAGAAIALFNVKRKRE